MVNQFLLVLVFLLQEQIKVPDNHVQTFLEIGKWVGGFAALGTLIWNIVRYALAKQAKKWEDMERRWEKEREEHKHDVDQLKEMLRGSDKIHEEHLRQRDDVCEACKERMREHLHNLEKLHGNDVSNVKQQLSKIEVDAALQTGHVDLVNQKVDQIATDLSKMIEMHGEQSKSLTDMARNLAVLSVSCGKK